MFPSLDLKTEVVLRNWLNSRSSCVNSVFLEIIQPHPQSHQFLIEVDADSPPIIEDDTDLERRIAHAVAADVVSEIQQGWICNDIDDSLRRIPAATEEED